MKKVGKQALVLKGQMMELARNLEVEQLESQVRKASLDRADKLFELGLISVEAVDEKRLEYEKAKVQMHHLAESQKNQEATQTSQLAKLDSEVAQAERDLQEANRQLGLTRVQADRSGVLTFVLNEPGRLVSKGEVLARIAKMDAYRVEASLSDYYARQIQKGQPVKVEVNNMELDGQVERVLPTVEAGALAIWVALAEPNHPGLRPALRVQAHVLTDLKSQVLKIEKGPAFNGSGRQEVFVIQGGFAEKREVVLGGENHREVEVLEGLKVGDKVVISNIEKYRDKKKLRVRS